MPIILAITVLGLLLITIQFAKSAYAAPPGCSSDQPYNCAMSRRKFDQLVNQWCGLAFPDKQVECRLRFLGFVFTSPNSVLSNAGFRIPYYCKINYTHNSSLGLTIAQELEFIPDFCYVVPRRNSDYYQATVDIINECGLADEQDRACVLRIQQQFLHDFNADWAEEPGPEEDTASASDAININNSAGKTKFFERVSSYIKWFTLGIGILAVFGLVISGIQYAAAQDNPQAVSGAKTRIYNIVIGIFIYVFMFAILQWLIPGGIFKL